MLPVSLIILLLAMTAAPVSLETLLLFLAGAVLLVVGMGLFTLGADMAMMPMGEALGRKVLCCLREFGAMNGKNRELMELAKKAGTLTDSL